MSQSDPRAFADRLMKSESQDDNLRQRYETAKLSLTERQLTTPQRWMGWLALPLYGWLIVGTAYLLLKGDPALPQEWFVLEAVSALGLLMVGLWILRVLLRKGRVKWIDDQAMEWICGVGLCALVFALLEVASSLEDARSALRLQGVALVLLSGGVFSALLERIRRSKLETRVKLIELELRVAELAQKITPPSSGAIRSES